MTVVPAAVKIVLSALAFICLPAAAAAESADAQGPLKGRVEETGIAPVRPVRSSKPEPVPEPVLPARPVFGKGSADSASGGLEAAVRTDAGSPWIEQPGEELGSGSGLFDPETGMLKGRATLSDRTYGGPGDPDLDDQELMIEWDRWRNRLLHAIQSGMQESLNNPNESRFVWDPIKRMMVSKYPLGTVAWFFCQVTPGRRIVNVKIKQSSGFADYDQAVIDAIQELDGSSILKFPGRSRRTIVNQIAGIRTATSSQYQYFQFGDVERVRLKDH